MNQRKFEARDEPIAPARGRQRRGGTFFERGFTLVELMIVVGTVAALAVIAVPSYKDAVQKGRRAEARASLMQAASALERYYTMNNIYTTDLAAAGSNAFTGDSAAKSYYTMTVTAAPAGIQSGFTVTAEPQNWTDSVCGSLSLTQSGAKGRSGPADLASCW